MMIAKSTSKQGILGSLSASSKSASQSRYLAPILGIVAVAAIGGCTFQSYAPKPITPSRMAIAFENRSLDDPKFATFLAAQTGQTSKLPIATWDLPTLTYAAHYFHPDLNIARAEWQLAQAKAQTAKQKPLPTINGGIARSNRANGDINPFAYSFGIDLPIVTHGKNEIKIAGFAHLSNIAKLKIAQTAWQLRQQVASTFINLQDNALQIEIAKKEIALNQAISNMLTKRLQYGEASSLEISAATRQLQLSEADLQKLTQQALSLKAALAKNVGVPLSAVQTLQFDFDGLAAKDIDDALILDAKTTQQDALLNRLDIRIGLEEYAIAENQLKLAIAKQYPDVSISPGVGYEFGDHVWSLGFSSLLTLLQKNKAGIAEAKAFRRLSVAKFEQLQTNVMAEASIARAQYIQANQQRQSRQLVLNQTKEAYAKVASQFDAGIIDRLNLTLAKTPILTAEKNLIASVKQLNLAKLNVENSLQKPL